MNMKQASTESGLILDSVGACLLYEDLYIDCIILEMYFFLL